MTRQQAYKEARNMIKFGGCSVLAIVERETCHYGGEYETECDVATVDALNDLYEDGWKLVESI